MDARRAGAGAARGGGRLKVNFTRRQAGALFARALLWLPLALGAWHLAAVPLSWIGATLARPAVQAAAGKVAAVKVDGSAALFSVELEEPYRAGAAPRRALADLEVKPRLYTFGLALFLALGLAARESRRPAALAAGTAVLLVVPAWGITFDVLRQLAASPQLAPFIAWPPWAREAIALGYQVGSLLLPTLVPVALWLAIARGFWDARYAARRASEGVHSPA